ncbi:glycosyltransferase family 4 protein [Cohnella thailandensis]|uniref:Glycosyltransferase family 4 protein n=1 Tax=Cohnella thailandensis TaxID=557557 RepID=A0A841SV67_9BACL|nr:glycosyltransferase family 4 protein [Cohnella thailandensis]MBB6635814.1 glycosyltransferase family 4 protein [Cohnella thailandensis]MBP1976192.1 glycosyltransferase involved in cell wall biosynthesis [Cohnella thailandensis]
MRVVLINSLYTPHIIGGAEISTQILAEALAEAAEVHVLTLGGQQRREGITREKIRGVTVHRLPHNSLYWIGQAKRRSVLARTARRLTDLYNPLQIKAVKERLEAIRPDLIHTQNLSGFGAAVWTANASLGVPIVHTLRDYSLLSPVSSPIGNPALARLYAMTSSGFSRKVSAVVGISSHILKRHTDAGLFADAAGLVIPNAVEGEISAAERDFERKPLRIGYFGRIEPEKGVRELVEAALPLPPAVVERIVVCGEGSLKQELQDLCRDDPRFVFPGKVKPAEARSLMARTDANFVPSIWEEPFGRVIIESYQVGTPVYASAVGGIPDAVWNPDEFLFKPGSAAAIRAKILDFHDLSGEEKRRIQQQCVRHCRKFTQASLLEKHLDLYGRMLSGNREFAARAVYGQVN